MSAGYLAVWYVSLGAILWLLYITVEDNNEGEDDD